MFESDSKLPGVPEGLRAVRYGIYKEGDFILQGEIAVPVTRSMGGYGLIVEADEGFEIAFDIQNNCYNVMRKMEKPVTITATYRVDNKTEYNRLKRYLPEGPGFQGLEECEVQ